MSYTRIFKFVRPTLSVPFYQVPNNTLEYFQAKYGIIYNITFSEDKLTRTIAEIFPDKETYQSFIADPITIELKENTTTYNNSLSVIVDVSFIEE